MVALYNHFGRVTGVKGATMARVEIRILVACSLIILLGTLVVLIGQIETPQKSTRTQDVTSIAEPNAIPVEPTISSDSDQQQVTDRP